MNDTNAVGGAQGAAGLQCEINGLSDAKGAPGCQYAGKIVPSQKLHYDEGAAVTGGAKIVYGDNVRVVQGA